MTRWRQQRMSYKTISIFRKVHETRALKIKSIRIMMPSQFMRTKLSCGGHSKSRSYPNKKAKNYCQATTIGLNWMKIDLKCRSLSTSIMNDHQRILKSFLSRSWRIRATQIQRSTTRVTHIQTGIKTKLSI